jgi:hypothetical protein
MFISESFVYVLYWREKLINANLMTEGLKNSHKFVALLDIHTPPAIFPMTNCS